jgi:hypothetical protein
MRSSSSNYGTTLSSDDNNDYQDESSTQNLLKPKRMSIPSNLPNRLTLQDVLAGFFYDDKVVRNLNKHGLDVAKSHLTILVAAESDEYLQLSILLDGRAVDFLLGPHGLARAMTVKTFLRGLTESHQLAAVHFYISIYSNIVQYYSDGYFICPYYSYFSPCNDTLTNSIEKSFQNFKSRLR